MTAHAHLSLKNLRVMFENFVILFNTLAVNRKPNRIILIYDFFGLHIIKGRVTEYYTDVNSIENFAKLLCMIDFIECCINFL